MYEAMSIAEELEDGGLAATAQRKPAWVEFLRARYQRALALLGEAAPLAADEEAELAWVELTMGGCLTDVADYPSAIGLLRSAVERAEGAGTARPEALATAVARPVASIAGRTPRGPSGAQALVGPGQGGRMDCLSPVA